VVRAAKCEYPGGVRVVQRSTQQAGRQPLGRASIVDSYWLDFGVFAMLYSLGLPLLAI
jgi:hypothetical protein